MSNQRTVFFISDGTAITSEALGQSLLSQFSAFHFEAITIPFIDSTEKAQIAVSQINQLYELTQAKPIVFSTIIKPDIKVVITESQSCVVDLLTPFIQQLEDELQSQSEQQVGLSHALEHDTQYMDRMDAVNYALKYDDGAYTKDYDTADIILVGVSRCGKTPTCLYLAIQFGIFAANYPFTEEDFMSDCLPRLLQPHKDKCYGLTISPQRLATIREVRRPHSRYAELKTCQKEIKLAEQLFEHERIPSISSTNRSIEEIATKILVDKGIKRSRL